MATVEALNFLPAPDSIIEPTDTVQFDVRSLTAIIRIIATFTFDGFTFREVAFEGDPAAAAPALGFAEVYAPSSTIETIVDGAFFRYRLVLNRTTVPGAQAWPASPKLTIVAFNTDGEEV